MGNLGCFSFYPGKNLGGFGDGGLVTTNDEALARAVRQRRSYGEAKKYHHVEKGVNTRLDTMQAALLNIKLPRLTASNEGRRRAARMYDERLARIPAVTPPAAPADELSHVYHLYVIRTPKRDELQAFLNTKGIQSGIHYPIPIHRAGGLPRAGLVGEPAAQHRAVRARDPVAADVPGAHRGAGGPRLRRDRRVPQVGRVRFPSGHPGMRKRLFEAVIVVATASLLAVAMTYPLAFQLGQVGRIETGDGQWSIWIVNWVARTLVTDPLHVFDANIFYPHRGTLAYSETNLVAGALAVPAYWATKNPYLAHNLVLLLCFVLAAIGGYFLARRLTGSRPAAAVSALLFAFCPYIFAHTAHIHLMLTAGLPFALLAFHRLADAPSAGRGAALGAVMALTGLACGYYGIYAALIVSLASVYYLVSRRYWTNGRYYLALATGAGVAALLLAPFIKQYVDLGEGNRPVRELKDQFVYAANWSSYLASGGLCHRWILNHIGEWRDVLFPGFTSLTLATAGVWAAVKDSRTGIPSTELPSPDASEGARLQPSSRVAVSPVRETTGFYSLLTAFTLWLSFGPKAGLSPSSTRSSRSSPSCGRRRGWGSW